MYRPKVFVPRAEDQTAVRADTNKMLVAKSRVSISGQLVLIVVSMLVILGDGLRAAEFMILVGLLLLNLSRFLLSCVHRKFTGSREHGWFKFYVATTLPTSFLWASLVIEQYAYKPVHEDDNIVLLLICAGIAAAASASLSPEKGLARWFVASMLLPVAVLFLVGAFPHSAVSGVILIYCTFLMAQININHDAYWELRTRKDQLAAIVDATMEPIVIHDGGVILEVNRAFEDLFRYQSDAIVGQSILKLVHPDDHSKLGAHISSGVKAPLEVKGLKGDGSIFPVAGFGRWFPYQGGLARIACYQDLTDRRAAESALIESSSQKQQLAEAKERAAIESAKLKGEFLANMSHEIRTPLNAIIGITDIISETPLDGDQRRYLRLMKESGESLLGIINDILDFSKIDANKIELEAMSFSLAALVEGQTELLVERAKTQKVTLSTKIDPKLPIAVSGDYGRLGQILLNLISNAIKFTPEGMVLVRASLVRQDSNKTRVRFEVQDSGAGIPDEIGKKLFKPFAQADSSTARKHGGTGLGLSICKRLVELMSGEIGFTSEIGKGTTFWFEIPLTVSDHRPLAETYARKEFEDVNITVITDLLPNAEALTEYFKAWRFRVSLSTLSSFINANTNRQGECDVVVLASEIEPQFAVLSTLDGRRKIKVVRIDKEGCAKHSGGEQNQQVQIGARLQMPVRQSDLYNAVCDSMSADLVKPIINEANSRVNIQELSGLRVLVAEDNSTNQMIIRTLLRNLGVEAQIVNNGHEAVDAFARGKFDLVLMDCQMPELDGFGATERIRRLEKKGRGRTPIIALTASVLKEERDRCFQIGMDDFLSKPVRRDKLISALKGKMNQAA